MIKLEMTNVFVCRSEGEAKALVRLIAGLMETVVGQTGCPGAGYVHMTDIEEGTVKEAIITPPPAATKKPSIIEAAPRGFPRSQGQGN